ncbi:GNAT family N-acetyltransferase [Marinomonas epiphytica]
MTSKDSKTYISKSGAVIQSIPWDSELFSANIFNVTLDESKVSYSFNEIEEIDSLLMDTEASLATVRVSQSEVQLIHYLEKVGFNFIEVSYRPSFELSNLGPIDSDMFFISECSNSEVKNMGSEVMGMFEYGRYHQDPNILNQDANIRYKNWLFNAMNSLHQTVFKATNSEGDIVAFFVIEPHKDNEVHLSLVGVLSSFRGKGLAKTIWKSMCNFLKEEGYRLVSTSISSHNIAIFNLYVALGFSFPSPDVTLHKWYK